MLFLTRRRFPRWKSPSARRLYHTRAPDAAFPKRRTHETIRSDPAESGGSHHNHSRPNGHACNPPASAIPTPLLTPRVALADDVRRIVQSLPRRFDLFDVLGQAPQIVSAHVGSPRLKQQIRAVLLSLVERGTLREMEEDLFEKVAPSTATTGLDWPMEPGARTNRAELADLLGQAGSAGLGRGIFKPATGKKFSDHILLFHDPFNNPYGDEIAGESILYVGEGHARHGDQKMEGNNRSLAEQLEQGYQAHFFVRVRPGSPELRYVGPVVARDVRRVYRPEEKRTVFQYDLVQIAEATGRKNLSSAYSSALLMIHDDEREPGYEGRNTRRTTVERIVRDRAFRQLVLAAYGPICSVCGDPLEFKGINELDAAHIIPVADKGRDHIQNGLALCKRHHWAFDNGLFSVESDYTVAALLPNLDPHGEIVDGNQLRLPRAPQLWPHEFYLSHHRKKWSG